MRIANHHYKSACTRYCLGLGIVFLGLTQCNNICAAGVEEKTKLNCGVNALFLLLRLEEIPVTLDRLELALPPLRPNGYSMAELATVGASLGLQLEGVQFARGDSPLDRPAIAFLKDAKGGHFAVLRPVGSTGTMVQVIDPPHVPWIADYDRVFSAKPWTGRILVRCDAWIVRNMISLLMAVAGCILLVAGITRGWRTVRRNGR